MHDIIEDAAAASLQRTFRGAIAGRIAEGYHQARLKAGRDSQDSSRCLRLVYRAEAGADADFGRGQLHISGALARIEEMPEGALVFRRHDDDDAERAAGDMPHAGAGFRQLRQTFPVLHRDEMPRLAVLGALRASSRVEDALDVVAPQRFRAKFAYRPLGLNGVPDVHIGPFFGR